MKKGRLILYSGPSGVGKGTLREVFSTNDDLKLGYSISYTTRKKRESEVDKQDYFFVNKETFRNMINKQEFVEWAEFAGNFYGTSKSYINKLLEEGKNVLLEIEVVGAKQILQLFPNCLSIFLVPPSIELLEERLRGRSTETEESIASRIKRAKEEIPLQTIYDYVVTNDDVQRAAKEVENIILKEIK